jgi:hypothetical protein
MVASIVLISLQRLTGSADPLVEMLNVLIIAVVLQVAIICHLEIIHVLEYRGSYHRCVVDHCVHSAPDWAADPGRRAIA